MRSIFLLALLLALCTAAPVDKHGEKVSAKEVAENVPADNHEENDHEGGEKVKEGTLTSDLHREEKFFSHNEFELGDIGVSGTAEGGSISIGHQIEIDVHGHSHSHGSACSVDCGGGTQSRSRECKSPVAQHGGLTCEKQNLGPDTETKDCNLNPCPVNGGYTNWSDWSASCSVSCGGGTQSRSRECTNPEAQHGGLTCEQNLGPDTEFKICNQDIPCPINGGYNTWSEWSSCSVDCGGGTQSRSRECTSPVAQHGGLTCEKQNLGPDTESNACNPNPCPINGGYTTWSEWSCSVSCGRGTQLRSRSCTSPKPQHDGLTCEKQNLGPDKETKDCNPRRCPECSCSNLVKEGGFGNCEKEFMSMGFICWVNTPSTCTDVQENPMDPGNFYSAEACKSGSLPSICSANNAQYYPDPMDCSKFYQCSEGQAPIHQSCPDTTLWSSQLNICDFAANVQCQAVDGAWSSWSACSKICGGGQRTRSCNNPEPANGGKECPGDSTEDCNTDSCVLWMGPSPSQTFELPSLSPVNSDCQIGDPGMDGFNTEFQEVAGNVYGCNHEECKQYFPEQKTWSTLPETKFVSERNLAAGTLLEDKWVVQGGYNVQTTEVWTPGSEGEHSDFDLGCIRILSKHNTISHCGKWEEYPDLKNPMPVYDHCILTLNNKLMQIGGTSITSGTTSSCFLDGKEVASLKAPRKSHACAVFQGEVWVAGGDRAGGDQDVVEIYDPATNNWREGPRRPQSTSDFNPHLVENSDKLYYIGGDQIDKIYRLSLDKNSWEVGADIEKGNKYAAIVMKKPC